jgi:hypothetical protein
MGFSSSETSIDSSSQEVTIPSFEIEAIVHEFDFDLLNSLQFTFDEDQSGAISHIEGHNIANGDYVVSDGSITLLPSYLCSLDSGYYSLKMYAENGYGAIEFEILDRHNAYRVVNQSFETGDLFGWTPRTIFKGEVNLQSFVDEAIVSNGLTLSSSEPFMGHGDYVYARPSALTQSVWEERMGSLRSRPFTLSGNGYISFSLGGGQTSDLCYVSIREFDTDIEIARFGNSAFDGEVLVNYVADLADHINKRLYVDLNDRGGHSFDFMTFDNIETYHETIPTGQIAIDIRPQFAIDYIPNQMINGDFSQELTGWTISEHEGWENTSFTAADGVLRSNDGGDMARGLIRSSRFNVTGSGFVSMKLAAAQGVRFDKDTYVSILLTQTNTEIIRFANHRHNGNEFITYYIDLSDYLNYSCYVEIVDNATGSWDTIFVDDIATYYPQQPDITFADMAINLNY